MAQIQKTHMASIKKENFWMKGNQSMQKPETKLTKLKMLRISAKNVMLISPLLLDLKISYKRNILARVPDTPVYQTNVSCCFV